MTAKISIALLFLLTSSALSQWKEREDRGIVLEKKYISEREVTRFHTKRGFFGKKEVPYESTEPSKFIILVQCSHGNIQEVDDRYSYPNVNAGDSVTVIMLDYVSDGYIRLRMPEKIKGSKKDWGETLRTTPDFPNKQNE